MGADIALRDLVLAALALLGCFALVLVQPAPAAGAKPGVEVGRRRGTAYRARPVDPLTEQALDVAREVLERGGIAHVLRGGDGALIQAYDPADGVTVLGAVSLLERPGVVGCEVAPFLAALDGQGREEGRRRR